ncbi:hypothetical protein CLOSYM_01609 [[Clostridium] symbiosum ATCC 14940]|uniref:Uncharacterized protein n=1 Tax=[Clostridium] symbiosum ATCC 14940 TaxID=411472 RepID=A0ABC9TZY2_CLOSY|nr:hypothetical protein CLOSYM_01609 [[Clostridium] symbiosum ATCC 14940]
MHRNGKDAVSPRSPPPSTERLNFCFTVRWARCTMVVIYRTR